MFKKKKSTAASASLNINSIAQDSQYSSSSIDITNEDSPPPPLSVLPSSIPYSSSSASASTSSPSPISFSFKSSSSSPPPSMGFGIQIRHPKSLQNQNQNQNPSLSSSPSLFTSSSLSSPLNISMMDIDDREKNIPHQRRMDNNEIMIDQDFDTDEMEDNNGNQNNSKPNANNIPSDPITIEDDHPSSHLSSSSLSSHISSLREKHFSLESYHHQITSHHSQIVSFLSTTKSDLLDTLGNIVEINEKWASEMEKIMEKFHSKKKGKGKKEDETFHGNHQNNNNKINESGNDSLFDMNSHEKSIEFSSLLRDYQNDLSTVKNHFLQDPHAFLIKIQEFIANFPSSPPPPPSLILSSSSSSSLPSFPYLPLSLFLPCFLSPLPLYFILHFILSDLVMQGGDHGQMEMSDDRDHVESVATMLRVGKDLVEESREMICMEERKEKMTKKDNNDNVPDDSSSPPSPLISEYHNTLFLPILSFIFLYHPFPLFPPPSLSPPTHVEIFQHVIFSRGKGEVYKYHVDETVVRDYITQEISIFVKRKQEIENHPDPWSSLLPVLSSLLSSLSSILFIMKSLSSLSLFTKSSISPSLSALFTKRISPILAQIYEHIVRGESSSSSSSSTPSSSSSPLSLSSLCISLSSTLRSLQSLSFLVVPLSRSSSLWSPYPSSVLRSEREFLDQFKGGVKIEVREQRFK